MRLIRFIFILSSLSLKTWSLEALPLEVITDGIGRHFNHREAIQGLCLINKKFYDISQGEWTWRRVEIVSRKSDQGEKELDLLCQKITGNPKLIVNQLSIQSTPLGSQIQTLMNWVTTNTTLKSLTIQGCSLPRKHVHEIGHWLKNNKNLKSLDLSYNNLGYSTAAITEALLENQCLTSLNLNNTFPEEDMDTEIIERVMNTNRTLISFHFQNNKVVNTSIDGYITALSQNYSLIDYHLEGTADWQITPNASQRIKGYLDRNRNKSYT